MKKYISLVLVASLLLLLFGCAKQNEVPTNTTTDPSPATTTPTTMLEDAFSSKNNSPLFAIDKANGVTEILNSAVQVNDGLKQTSADGVQMAFDTKYGIMFCLYMPGDHGAYGESRGRVSLSYFPAAQPTNSKTIDISSGNEEYIPQILSLGEGKVRLIYEKFSRSAGEHLLCYRDFDAIQETLSDEKIIQQKEEDGSTVNFTLRGAFNYAESKGSKNHFWTNTEHILAGGCTLFRGEDGYIYGAAMAENSEAVLYRSKDDMATVEFFAIFPQFVQYEFSYVYLNDRIHAIYRTFNTEASICYVTSDDNGETWTEPVKLKGSIACRPRIIVHNGHILMAYNYHYNETGNRPLVKNGRTSVRMIWGENPDPNENPVVADLFSKYGMVNIAIMDILGDVYLTYSTSQTGMDYHNQFTVSGKDAIRYVKLGDLTTSVDNT